MNHCNGSFVSESRIVIYSDAPEDLFKIEEIDGKSLVESMTERSSKCEVNYESKIIGSARDVHLEGSIKEHFVRKKSNRGAS